MADRILDIADEPAELHVRHEQLVIERQDGEKPTVPLADLAVLVVSHPRVTFSQSVLSGLVERNGAFVVCNAKGLPVGMLMPLDAHYLQTERIAHQTEVSAPCRKRIWQQIVKAKVRAQARALERVRGHDAGLTALADRVKSGDPDNVEAQAARRYWGPLFDDSSFRRKREAEDQNRFLNYGYAVLRAIVARAVCAVGLHPSIGLHHHNRYNSFCLADDLMEPFRPIVDQAAVACVDTFGPDAPMDRYVKQTLLQALTGRFDLEGQSRTLFDVAARVASSLAAVYAGERRRLLLPET